MFGGKRQRRKTTRIVRLHRSCVEKILAIGLVDVGPVFFDELDLSLTDPKAYREGPNRHGAPP